MICCGAASGALGAAIGVASVLCLASPLGYVAGVLAGAATAALVIGLACTRLLRRATACLAALSNEGDEDEIPSHGVVVDRPVPALGSAAFDAWVAHLYDLLAHLTRPFERTRKKASAV
jgi:hypothetical protein